MEWAKIFQAEKATCPKTGRERSENTLLCPAYRKHGGVGGNEAGGFGRSLKALHFLIHMWTFLVEHVGSHCANLAVFEFGSDYLS